MDLCSQHFWRSLLEGSDPWEFSRQNTPVFLQKVSSGRNRICFDDFIGPVHLVIGPPSLAGLQALEEGSSDCFPCSVLNAFSGSGKVTTTTVKASLEGCSLVGSL